MVYREPEFSLFRAGLPGIKKIQVKELDKNNALGKIM